MTVNQFKDALNKAFDLGFFDAQELADGSYYLGKTQNHSATGAELVWNLLPRGEGKIKHQRALKAAYELGKMTFKDLRGE